MCAPMWNSSARIKRVTGRSMAVGIGAKQTLMSALRMSALEGEAEDSLCPLMTQSGQTYERMSPDLFRRRQEEQP